LAQAHLTDEHGSEDRASIPPVWIADSDLLTRARALAAAAHRDQRRATDRTSFLEHVTEVGRLLHEAGCDERLVAAGLLHDAVERGTLSEPELRSAMDDEISALVLALTEDASISSFDARKEALREQVAAAGDRAVTIFAADKLSDIRGLTTGVERFEDTIEARMGTTVESMAGHYEESVTMIEERAPESAFVPALRAELERLRELGSAESPATRPGIVETLRGSGWSAVPHEVVQEQG
jgi:(p)ppGpp synthase/HD superfamily hydrolase